MIRESSGSRPGRREDDAGSSGPAGGDEAARARRARDSASRSAEESSPILLPGGNAPESGFWSRWKTPLLVVATLVALGGAALGLLPMWLEQTPEEFERIEGLPQEWQQVEAERPDGSSGTLAEGEGGTALPDTSPPVFGGSGETGAAGADGTAEAFPPDPASTTAPGEAAAGEVEAGSGGLPEASSPAVRELDRLADSLSASMVRYRERRRDFELDRLRCEGLSRGYRQVDETFLGFLRVYDRARARLDSSRRASYQELMEETDAVNRHFDSTRCPRPE